MNQRIFASTALKATVLIRVPVGWVFLSEGIQKFLFPESLGVGRFAKIGIPYPWFTGPFVGVVEVVFGTLIIVGFLIRLSSIPLLIDISVAIATTKIPMLLDKGFWAAAHEARTDLCMLLGLLCGFRRRRTLIPEGTRTAFRAEGERFSERSDAGPSIVPEVFGFVKKNLSGGIRSVAEEQCR